MENTIENKAKFFAQYWGQSLYTKLSYDGEGGLKPVEYFSLSKGMIEEGILELTSLSDITDEDAIEVAKILLRKQRAIYDFTVSGNVERQDMDYTHGCDAEEYVSVPFKGIPNKLHENGGWKCSNFHVRIVIQDAYNDNFYFNSLIRAFESTAPWSYNHLTTYCQLEAIDYLRSRGYALPWMGVSVEEQIKRCWIKLKTK